MTSKAQPKTRCAPDATQHEAMSALTRVFDALWRNGASLIRGRQIGVLDGPGSAAHRFTLRCARDT
jgi:hypothetical protein